MSILDAIMVAAEISPVASAGTSSANPEDARERELREAVATLDLLPGFVSALGTRPDQQRANLVREVQQKTNEVTSLRQQLMTAVREKANLDLSLEALDRAAGSLSNEVVTNALVQITRIRTRLPAVREITLASSRGNPRINVSLHPMVLAGEDGQHYLCDRLHFAFPLDGGSVPEWATVTRSRQSPHPHVNSGGSTCWGQAETPLRQALERRDFVTVVTLIVGWASIYNRNSPYVHLRGNCGFPAVNLAPGWHPEIPVRPV
jgi:hypothetical protein